MEHRKREYAACQNIYQGFHVERHVIALLHRNVGVACNKTFTEQIILIGRSSASCKDTDVIRSAESVTADPAIVEKVEVSVFAILYPFLNYKNGTVLPSKE